MISQGREHAMPGHTCTQLDDARWSLELGDVVDARPVEQRLEMRKR